MGNRHLFIFLFLASISITASAYAASPLVIKVTDENHSLGYHLDYLEDKTNQLSVSDVQTPEVSRRFKPCLTDSPGFGFTSSAYWFRFVLKNTHHAALKEIIEINYPLLDHVDLFLPDPSSGKFHEIHTGDGLPYGSRRLNTLSFALPVEVPPSAGMTCYMRVKTSSSLNMPVTIWSYEAFINQMENSDIALGIYFGALIAMLAYNLILFIIIKDIIYLYYDLFVLFYILFQATLTGISFKYLWPDWVWWANNSLPFFICMAHFFGTQFTRKVLDTRRRTPMLDTILRSYLLMALCGAAASVVLPYAIIIKVATFLALGVVIHIMAGIIILLQGYGPARYYVIAWGVSLTGITIYALKTFGIIPNNFFTNWGLQMSSAWEIILLSLALADKISTLEKEKEQITLESARKLQHAYNELQDLNVDLEDKVHQRTRDLEESNALLIKEAHERRLAEKKAEKASEAKSFFLANMSHELRTPLNAITGTAGLMLALDLPEKLVGHIRVIQAASNTLLMLVSDILDFSKIEANEMELEARRFSLDALFEELADMFCEQAYNKGINIVVDVDADVPREVVGDKMRLKQVLINLVSNALKFTEKGEITVSCSVHGRQNNEWTLIFSVKDTGIGIETDKIEDLFNVFVQADTSTTRRFGGSGLGLAISKRIVELMNGSIKAESEKGKGSTFYFTAVLKEVDEREKETAVSGKMPGTGSTKSTAASYMPGQLSGCEILLVEDNRINRQVATEILKMAGTRVTGVSDGYEALKKLEEQQFSVVLMDIQMPGIDGFETVRRIRQLENHKDTPVIAMTANALRGDRERCLECGMNDYISKPVEPRTLYAKLMEWVKPPAVEHVNRENDGHQSASIEEDGIIKGLRLDGIDGKSVAGRFAGTGGLFIDLLREFVSEYENASEKLEAMIEKGQQEEALRFVHSLKGAASNLSAVDVAKVSEKIEDLLNRGESNSASELIVVLSQELTRVFESVSRLDMESEGGAGRLNKASRDRMKDPDKKTVQKELMDKVEELDAMLSVSDIDAEDLWQEIRKAFDSERNRERLERIDSLIENMEFEKAGELLKDLTARNSQ